jgi:hypothetical protein
MKKSTNLIYFPAGCYGTFFEWLYSYFSNQSNKIEVPFTSTGSSHNYIGNFYTSPQLFDYVNLDQTVDIVRIHPSIFDQVNSNYEIQNNSYCDIVDRDLTYIDQYFNKIVVLHPTPSTKLWMENNVIEKCVMTLDIFESFYKPYGFTEEFFSESFTNNAHDRLKCFLKTYCGDNKAKYWGKDSIDNLEIWELRELLSLYWDNRYKDFLTCWDTLKTKFKHVKFISLDEIKIDPVGTILSYLNFLEITVADFDDLALIVNKWSLLQKHQNKDSDVAYVVDSVLTSNCLDWAEKDFSVMDEAYIQRGLRDNQIDIKCFGLNAFPTNTQELTTYLNK